MNEILECYRFSSNTFYAEQIKSPFLIFKMYIYCSEMAIFKRFCKNLKVLLFVTNYQNFPWFYFDIFSFLSNLILKKWKYRKENNHLINDWHLSVNFSCFDKNWQTLESIGNEKIWCKSKVHQVVGTDMIWILGLDPSFLN